MTVLAQELSLVPISIADPAFHACLTQSASREDLVADFKRLRGLDRIDRAFAREFVSFVHEFIYARLPAEALSDLRVSASHPQEAAHG